MLTRTAVPSGVLIRKTADIYSADERWTVAVIVEAPTPPPLGRWKAEAYRLLYSPAIRPFISRDEGSALFKLIGSWNFQPLRLTYTSILNNTRAAGDSQGPAPRVKRDLFNVIGEVSHELFGTATEEEVVALQDGLRAVAGQESAVYHNQFRLLSVVNTTRRYVWKNRDDINLLVNASRYLSHTLVNLSAFVNVLSRKVHAMWVVRHVRSMMDRVDQALERSREEFDQYRDITLAVEGGRLTETLLSELDLQSVLRNLRGTPMTLGWYYAFTPIKPVMISNEQIVFAADVWSRSKDADEEWALQAFPVRDRGFHKRTIIRPSVITDVKRQFVFRPTVCRGLSTQVCIMSHVEKHACELGLISGTPNGCQLRLTSRETPFELHPYRPNEWILVPHFDNSTVTVRCDNRRHQQLVVTQVELWWVHPRCNIDTANLTTHGVKSYHLDVIVNYAPPTILNVTFHVENQLKVEIPVLLKFHPHLEVKGIPSDVLSDPGFYPVYNPHHVIYGLSALIGGAILAAVIGIVCVRRRCAVRPFKTTVKPPTSDRSLRRSESDPGSGTPNAKWSANDDNVTFSF